MFGAHPVAMYCPLAQHFKPNTSGKLFTLPWRKRAFASQANCLEIYPQQVLPQKGNLGERVELQALTGETSGKSKTQFQNSGCR